MVKEPHRIIIVWRNVMDHASSRQIFIHYIIQSLKKKKKANNKRNSNKLGMGREGKRESPRTRMQVIGVTTLPKLGILSDIM